MSNFTEGTTVRKGILALILVLGAAGLLSFNSGGRVASAQTGPTLRIAGPANGSTVAAPVAVQVEVQNANLKAADLGDQASQHLHYFIDIDPATVIQEGQPIPTGRDNIVHSAATAQTLNLPAGQHSVWVVMANVNHIPLTPGVQGQVSFTVQSAAAASTPAAQAPAGSGGATGTTPAAVPRTGTAGSLDSTSASTVAWAVLVFAIGLASVAVFRRRENHI